MLAELTDTGVAKDATVPIELSRKKVKLMPAESVKVVVLTDDTESSALAGWPARKIAGFTPNVIRVPVCALMGTAGSSQRTSRT